MKTLQSDQKNGESFVAGKSEFFSQPGTTYFSTLGGDIHKFSNLLGIELKPEISAEFEIA